MKNSQKARALRCGVAQIALLALDPHYLRQVIVIVIGNTDNFQEGG
jgi:hypothetical protein